MHGDLPLRAGSARVGAVIVGDRSPGWLLHELEGAAVLADIALWLLTRTPVP